tara:strand:+ start:390 stop:1646 length:1257 start_codon:yes stop_codon:yes gene_type:complete
MASTYVNDLRLEEIASGEQSTSWGATTNTNLELIGEAFSYGTRAIADASTDNITIADGASDADRSIYLKCTGGGQACTVTLLPNTSSKIWIMENATSFTLTFTQGSGANVAVLAGQVKIIATDGAGAGAVVYDLTQDLAVPDLFVDDDVTLQSDGAIINFGENSDVTLTHVHDSGLTLSAGANATALSITSTNAGASVAPTINLIRDSGSPADNDQLGYITFIGENSAGAAETYAQLYTVVTDVTDGEEDSDFYINTMKAGSAANNLIVKNSSVSFKVNNTVVANQGFAQNTALVFFQASAPTGWTKSTANTDKALRVTSGSGGGTGGSVAFETAFASQSVSGTTGATTLATSQIPSHSHAIRGPTVASGSAQYSAGATAGTNSAAAGGGGSHTHSFSSSAINLDVSYLNVIVCTKDA